MTSLAEPPAAILAVVGGPRAGARQALPADTRITISTGWHADVVLRDRTQSFRASLTLPSGGVPRLQVEEGEAALLGVPVRAGESCLWPAFTPLSVGPHCLAHGPEASPRWADAAQLAQALAAGQPQEAAPDAETETAGDLPGRIRAALARLPAGRRRLLSGGVAVAALGAALLTTPGAGVPHMLGSHVPAARQILADEGLDGLELDRDPVGIIRVSGAVADRDALGRAAARLQAARIPYRLDLLSGADLASAAEDIARQAGVPAVARAIGPASIELTVAPMDEATRTRLMHALRADLPGLGDVRLREGLAAPDPAPPRTVSEAAKRIATVVAGDPGYVLTADGARYFTGALLPSGHVLQRIEDGAILVERNGAITRIDF